MTDDGSADSRRESLALWSPAVIAFGYSALTSTRPLLDRTFLAAFIGAIVWVGGFLAYIVASAAASKLCGRQGVTMPATRDIVAGTLLFTSVWVWWQYDRDATIDRVAACTSRAIREEQRLDPGEAVISCYRDTVATNPNDE